MKRYYQELRRTTRIKPRKPQRLTRLKLPLYSYCDKHGDSFGAREEGSSSLSRIHRAEVHGVGWCGSA